MSDEIETADGAVIQLDADHSIILFEFLWEQMGMPNPPPITTAEAAVLNTILGQLEKQLVAPFRTDYDSLLFAARLRLTPSEAA